MHNLCFGTTLQPPDLSYSMAFGHSLPQCRRPAKGASNKLPQDIPPQHQMRTPRKDFAIQSRNHGLCGDPVVQVSVVFGHGSVAFVHFSLLLFKVWKLSGVVLLSFLCDCSVFWLQAEGLMTNDDKFVDDECPSCTIWCNIGFLLVMMMMMTMMTMILQ